MDENNINSNIDNNSSEAKEEKKKKFNHVLSFAATLMFAICIVGLVALSVWSIEIMVRLATSVAVSYFDRLITLFRITVLCAVAALVFFIRALVYAENEDDRSSTIASGSLMLIITALSFSVGMREYNCEPIDFRLRAYCIIIDNDADPLARLGNVNLSFTYYETPREGISYMSWEDSTTRNFITESAVEAFKANAPGADPNMLWRDGTTCGFITERTVETFVPSADEYNVLALIADIVLIPNH